jgi:CDGSH-type Zn-finger protein
MSEHPTVIICPGGPLLLRGDHVVQDEEGGMHRTTRPVSAVCRCGKTSTSPWCDGTHKVIPTRNRP